MTPFPTIAKNTLAQVAGRSITVLFSIGLVAILTRYFGKAGYGEYAFITAFILLFANISDWGTNIITVREASQNKVRQPIIFGTVILFRLFLAGLALVLANIAIRLNPSWQNFVYATAIASGVLVFLSLKTSLFMIFQTILKLEKAALFDALVAALFFVLVIAALWTKMGLPGIMASWVIATLVGVLYGFYLAKRETKINLVLDKGIIRKVFWEALPMGALLIVFSIYNRVDIVILEHFQGEEAVGIYSLAYKVHDNLVLGAAFLMNAAFPILSSDFSKRAFGRLREIYQKVFDLLFLAGILVLGTFFVFAPQIVKILAGLEFSDSAIALRILVFATFVAYLNHLTGYSLVAFGKQRVSLLIGVLALLFNVSSNWIFIPLFSWRAAAYITVLTESLVLVLSTIAIFNTIKLFPSPTSFIKTTKNLIYLRGRIF